MAKIDKVQEVAITKLHPYEKNAKLHSEAQVEKIAASIQEFGFISPCLIDTDGNIIAGHGRVMAAQRLGMTTVPCVYVEGLTEEQRRAYILADNKLTELGDWDMDLVFDELRDLNRFDFDVELTGFQLPEGNDWFETREKWDRSRQEGNDEYNEFLDKFEQAKTTDDCFTPDNVYEIVRDWVVDNFQVKAEDFIRPFYPGGDYQKEHYAGKIVVDNPPFSILSEIIDWYREQGIRFFLFSPGMSTLGYLKREDVTAICTYATVTYENGAQVTTNFLTNMLPGVAAMSEPDFYQKIDEANEENERKLHRNLPKYDYPIEVITSARMGYLSKYGQRLVIPRESCTMIRQLDAQKESGAAIYGSGLLLSERAAAERAAAKCFPLSEREREIQRSLGGEENGN